MVSEIQVSKIRVLIYKFARYFFVFGEFKFPVLFILLPAATVYPYYNERVEYNKAPVIARRPKLR